MSGQKCGNCARFVDGCCTADPKDHVNPREDKCRIWIAIGDLPAPTCEEFAALAAAVEMLFPVWQRMYAQDAKIMHDVVHATKLAVVNWPKLATTLQTLSKWFKGAKRRKFEALCEKAGAAPALPSKDEGEPT